MKVEDMTGVSSMVNQTLDEVDFRQEVSQVSRSLRDFLHYLQCCQLMFVVFVMGVAFSIPTSTL